MSTQQKAPLDIQEVPRLLTKHSRMIVMGAIAGGILFACASFVFPMRYKVHFVLTIYTKYFQSPLIGDFVPSIGEFEAKSQRESLIRQTLTPEYLDSLGTKYGIYSSTSPSVAAASSMQKFRRSLRSKLVQYGLVQPTNTESRLSSERQNLLKRINIFSINDTTFNVEFSYSDPAVTYQVTKDIYSQIIRGLLEVRMNMLITVRDAIHRRLTSLTSNGPNPASRKPMEEELKSVQEELHALRALYTDSHPMVQELIEREQSLKRVLNVIPANGTDGAASNMSIPEADPAALHQISDDLIKKLNYLDITIDSDRQHQDEFFAVLEDPQYPTSSSGPGKAVFVLGGFILGFICSLFIAIIREYFDYTAVRASVLAQRLGVPVIGDLPSFPQYTHSSMKPPKSTGNS